MHKTFQPTFPFRHEGLAASLQLMLNVLPLHSPSSEENSNLSVFRINGYHMQQNEKR